MKKQKVGPSRLRQLENIRAHEVYEYLVAHAGEWMDIYQIADGLDMDEYIVRDTCEDLRKLGELYSDYVTGRRVYCYEA